MTLESEPAAPAEETPAASSVSPEKVPVFRAVGEAFVREGVKNFFVLLGDGNMHWGVDMATRPGVKLYHFRHEHCALSAAMAYGLATGQVGVASTTCGPGFAQTITALTTATHARIPFVLFAGETPLSARWHPQFINQASLAEATGARYIACHNIGRVMDNVRDAFFYARTERRAVVIGIPYDLQRELMPAPVNYQPSTTRLPPPVNSNPEPDLVQQVADRIARARKPIILAGRGVIRSGAKADVIELADRIGALLTTTLPARGLFEGHAFSLGISGGYGTELSHALYAEADLVIAIGASLASQTLDAGKLVDGSFVVQIDPNPHGLHHGLYPVDLYMRSDAKKTVRALIEALPAGKTPDGFRSAELAGRIAAEPPDPFEYPVPQGTHHPRDAIAALDRVIPKDWEIFNGAGHSAYFTSLLRDRSPEKIHMIRDFGAIGNSIGFAIGVAVARDRGKVVLIEGDGGLLMHIQELETIRRHGLKLVICVLNDGAFGSEIHKLRHEGFDASESIFGIGDLGRVAEGFGLGGANVDNLDDLPGLFEAYEAGDRSELWNFPISDLVMSPAMRRSRPKK